jgi:hypothetical protein
LEVVTNESDALRVACEVGPTLLQRVGVAIDPDEPGTGGGVEDAERVPCPAERRVDEDPAVVEGREEKIDDGAGKDGAVLHDRVISYLPRALVAMASMPSAPPTEEPVSASNTIPWRTSRARPCSRLRAFRVIPPGLPLDCPGLRS